jgi:hypothetical protein
MANCKGCGAEIIWAMTEREKPMPLDAKSEKRFILRLPQGDRASTQLVETYTSHFVTCPKADEFRKDKVND